MSLTAELVAKVHRHVEDSGPLAGNDHLTDDDYAALVEAALAGRGPDEPIWLFAYGSLIWKPELDYVDEVLATTKGWHRAFCINVKRWRGTPDMPGLMMGLDRGGACRGVAYRLADGDRREQLGKLFRREMTAKPSTYLPRWLPLHTERGPMTALGFTINRGGWAFLGGLSEDEVVQRLSTACGHWGSCADYLYNTVSNLERRGIRDRNLWRLQHLVAEAIAARGSPSE